MAVVAERDGSRLPLRRMNIVLVVLAISLCLALTLVKTWLPQGDGAWAAWIDIANAMLSGVLAGAVFAWLYGRISEQRIADLARTGVHQELDFWSANFGAEAISERLIATIQERADDFRRDFTPRAIFGRRPGVNASLYQQIQQAYTGSGDVIFRGGEGSWIPLRFAEAPHQGVHGLFVLASPLPDSTYVRHLAAKNDHRLRDLQVRLRDLRQDAGAHDTEYLQRAISVSVLLALETIAVRTFGEFEVAFAEVPAYVRMEGTREQLFVSVDDDARHRGEFPATVLVDGETFMGKFVSRDFEEDFRRRRNRVTVDPYGGWRDQLRRLNVHLQEAGECTCNGGPEAAGGGSGTRTVHIGEQVLRTCFEWKFNLLRESLDSAGLRVPQTWEWAASPVN